MLGELEDGRRCRKRGLIRRHPGQPLTHPDGCGQFAAAEFRERGLWIEQIHLRRSAVLEQIDDAFGFWRMMRQAGQFAVGLEQRGERGDADARARAAEKMSACEQFVHGRYSFETASSRFRMRLATDA